MEIWKPVFGYENKYEISNYANIRSLNRTKITCKGLQKWKGKTLSPFIDSNGYLYVNLCDGYKAKKTALHIIVLQSFISQRPNNLIGLHNDGNKINCFLSNLRWGTYKENSNDSKIHGTFPIGSKSGKAKLKKEFIDWIKESKQTSNEISFAFEVASSTIRAIKIGQNWNSK